MNNASRFIMSVSLSLVLGFSAAVRAADAAANRSAVTTAVARSAAKARSITSAFIGIVPGILVTDPVSISTSIQEAMTIDYGDGTSVTYQPGDTPAHTYASSGTFAVKAITGSAQIITMNLTIVVPFSSTVAQVYGMGVSPDFETKDAVNILCNLSGAPNGSLDYGDGNTAIVSDGSSSSHVYLTNDFYNAVLTVTDGANTHTGSVSFTTPLSSGKQPEIVISGVTIAPNPAKVGEAVTFSGTISAKGVSGDLTGKLDFGDGTPPFIISGNAASALKDSLEHTYTANGVYTAVLTVNGTGAAASTKAFVIVGRGTVVNSTNGAFATEQDSAGGTVALQLNGSAVSATDASTSYDDTLPRATVIDGLLPTRAFATATVAVATTTLKDSLGNAKGKIRKTVVVGARASGDSAALADPPSNEIKLLKMSGKFLFTKTTPDQISFSGTIQLPAGFDPAKVGGNSIAVGIGNIVDTLLIDAKGKPLDKSTGVSQRIKKLSVKYPKLAGATAAGGEIAKVDITLSIPDMDIAGLDTEGITASLRSDEKKLKAANRFIQVDVLISGVAYETYVPVQYKVSSKGDAGQLSGRGSK